MYGDRADNLGRLSDYIFSFMKFPLILFYLFKFTSAIDIRFKIDMVSLWTHAYSRLCQAIGQTAKLFSTYISPKCIIDPPPCKHFVLNSIKNYDQIFVIGDVHGCYDEMMLLFKEAGILPMDKKILKIFVGDLVNKGTQNENVLKAIMGMESVLSVRGNHDEVVLRETKLYRTKSLEIREKNRWMLELRNDQIEFLKDMPYSISIPNLNCIIVHAGLVPDKNLNEQLNQDMISMRNILFNDDGSIIATSSDKEGDPWASAWRGPQHIYFGHDAKRGLQQFEFSTGLDTGCVYGNKLTGIFIAGPSKGKIVSVPAYKVHCPPTG